jgi:CheY-like chemotaxis protein/two-component sensor histidine kinase
VEAAKLDAAQAPRALEIARRQAEQLGRLIDDLLDVARITQGRVALRKERVRLAAVIERAVDGMRAFIGERGLALAVRLPPASVEVDADPARLEQVLVNLLSNAAKYTEDGGIAVEGEPVDGGQVAVRIRDTGIGIAPEMLPRVWDLFAQAEREIDRKQGGLGIGLTVARGLIEQHGGRIEARSDGIGKGAEFVVTLEALPVARDAAPAGAPAPAPLRPCGAHVLLVEDNRDAAESLTMLLDLYGHRVRTVYDGFAALDAARAEAPDVMLVDIGLPGMDGYEVARRIRGDVALHAVRLIALTGYGRDEDRQAALAAGFDHHLVKPVNPDRLHGLVTEVVTAVR